MRVLLDTCTFLWAALDDSRLSSTARATCRDPEVELWLSTASAFEIAVKHQLGKLPLPEPPDRFLPRVRERFGALVLDVDERSALHVGLLPQLHFDPFDRLIVAQAIVHGMTVLTPDEAIRAYPTPTMW